MIQTSVCSPEINQKGLEMSQTKRFAEAVLHSHYDKEGYCEHCTSLDNGTHDEGCIVLEAQTYLVEEQRGCNPEQTNELLEEAIQHFRKASVAVKDFAITKTMTHDIMKHYIKRAESHTAIADNLEALKNWLEKTK